MTEAEKRDMEERIDKIIWLREFIERWREIIQGGSTVKQLEPWARAYVLEAEKLLNSTYMGE